MKVYIRSAILPISDEDPDTRKELAKSVSDDEGTIAQLASDKDRKIREQLAKNPNTPIETLKKLSTDKSYKVRLAVAKNPNTPSAILAEMVKRERPEFTSYSDYKNLALGGELFKNPNTPLNCRLDLLKASGMRYQLDIVGSVARNKNTPVELLSAIADMAIQGEYGLVLENLARNRNLPVDILRKVANKSLDGYYSLDIRGALAKNPNTPADILLELLNYEYLSDEERDIILKHPNTPKDKVAELQAARAEEKKKNSLRQYIGKDIWLAGELYGISRDHPCYFRIVSRVANERGTYAVNVLYENTSWNTQPIETYMNEIENYRLDDSEDSDGQIYRPIETYTTEELLDKLYPNYD